MNKEAIIAKLAAYLEKTEDFLITEVPLVAQELIQWHLWSHLIPMLIWCVIGTIGLLVANCIRKKIAVKKEGGHYCGEEGADIMVFMVSLVILVVSLGVNLPEVIKAKVAPRVLLLEYLKK
jgi:hypothetical protein